jgi:hypothetical protein
MGGDVPTQPANSLERQAGAPSSVAAAGQAVMTAWAMAGMRTGIQAGWVWLLVVAARRVPWLPLPGDPPWWLEVVAGAVVTGGIAAGIGWLERRSRGTRWGRWAAGIGRWLMLGILQQPAYTARGKQPVTRSQ